MNSNSVREWAVWAYLAGILGSFLIVAALVWAMHRYTQPPPLGEDRAAARAKALGELRATEADALEHAGWVEQTKGIVRLPIEEAVKMIEQDWGPAARSNLISRVEKATAPPP